MKIHLNDGLPYISASLFYQNQRLELANVLLDTGSAGTILSADRVLEVGLHYEVNDIVHRIRGVGGAEFVFTKIVDKLALNELQVNDFEVEIGAMDYGIDIDGIIGMDFLTLIGATIDLHRLEIY